MAMTAWDRELVLGAQRKAEAAEAVARDVERSVQTSLSTIWLAIGVILNSSAIFAILVRLYF